MNLGSLLVPLRCSLPELWRVLLMLPICYSFFVVGLYFGPRIQDSGAQWFEVFTWATAAFLWWLCVGIRACTLVYEMFSLRLPGCFRIGVVAVILHLFISVFFPLIFLLLFGEKANLALLSGALFLGSTLALLVLSIPNVLWFLPMLLLFSTRYWTWLPETALDIWGLSLLALTMTSLFWIWYSRTIASRTWWHEPSFVMLDKLPNFRQDIPLFKATVAKKTGSPTKPFSLVSVLGPGLQSPSQLYGWRGRLGILVFLLISIMMMTQAELSNSLKSIFIYVLVGSCAVITLQPTTWLREAQAGVGQALLADLYLLPGLTSNHHFLHSFCKQVLRSQAEKLILFVCVFVPVGIIHDINPPVDWGQWFILWLVLILLFSLLMVLLACLFTSNWWRWLLSSVLIMAGIATTHMLLHSHGSRYEWIAPLWMLVTVVILVVTGQVYRILLRRGMPYF